MGAPNHAVANEEVKLPDIEQLQGPYLFAVDDLPAVEAIDLGPILPEKRVSTALGEAATGVHVMKVAIFVSEKAEGEIGAPELEDIVDKTSRASYEVDDLFNIMDVIEPHHERVDQLLGRVRDESSLGTETLVDISKTTWVLTAFRHASQTNR